MAMEKEEQIERILQKVQKLEQTLTLNAADSFAQNNINCLKQNIINIDWPIQIAE